MTDVPNEHFASWGSRVSGGIGLAAVAAVVLLGLVGDGGDYHPAAYVVCGLVALVLWTVLLRPAASAVDGQLVLRNPLSTVSIPLAAVEKVVVRQFLVVSAGNRSFSNTGVGRSFRQGIRDDKRGDATAQDVAGLSYGALAERRLNRLAEDARLAARVELYSDEQVALADGVRRQWAWVEIGIGAVLLVALVVAVVVV